ncbi:FKBP-type peptidyl-prolyl cis-trans isomerase [Fluviicola sp.]|jgi:FKBP-type peptidyl-prolyl cis-trans isomerase|uniref:FKBP-type peptidyl-prolyl cis-trans isomerase n=1 Tax=Fluviicola sp. TaxID=1917219 RepID=UPI00283985FD|nr:FKBP-type peptidyl-prolyl cis-trans isomerase [Fluviicola sp.]MDR0801850.1 FKBP-type peptidyl-prolyl cis-trans isomerase [Fluviicola sp.]
MKKVILASFLIALNYACSNDSGKTAVEALPVNSPKQQISYLMGADNAGQVVQDPNFAKYDKAEILKGFKTGLDNAESFDAACQQSIQSLLGKTQQEFNEQYVKEASLCIGKFLGGMFKTSWEQAKSFDEFDKKYLIYGFQLGLNKADTLIKKEVKTAMMKDFMTKINNRVLAEVTKREDAFFAKVKAMKGIRELQNGIYLETIQAGNGANPTATSDVKAHYVLMNTDGDTLQSSLNNPQVPVFNLGAVIPGWTIGIPAMKKGGKYKLYVPQNMAYGRQSPDPNSIPPFATLVFYVDLIDFGPTGSMK